MHLAGLRLLSRQVLWGSEKYAFVVLCGESCETLPLRDRTNEPNQSNAQLSPPDHEGGGEIEIAVSRPLKEKFGIQVDAREPSA